MSKTTGFKDRNGIELKENDRIEIHQFLFDGNEIENTLTGTIVYDPNQMAFCLIDIENTFFYEHTGYGSTEEHPPIPIFQFYGLHDESFSKVRGETK